jgi:hypothetical protein
MPEDFGDHPYDAVAQRQDNTLDPKELDVVSVFTLHPTSRKRSARMSKPDFERIE